MTANVKLVTAEKSSVLKVPNAALRFRPAARRRTPPGAPDAAAERRRRRAAAGAALARADPRAAGATSLKLDEEQQKKLDPILQDSREQLPRPAGPPRGRAPRAGQKIREATRVRIREILTDAQQARYEEIAGASARRGATRRSAGPRVGPRARRQARAPSRSRSGISDGAATEVLRGEVKEGQDVIVGLAGGAADRRPPSRRRPGPRFRL